MAEAVTDIIVARSHDPERMRPMVIWSAVAHGILAIGLLLAPWRSAEAPPQEVMTISLGGAPGPRTGGMTQMGGRAVQAPAPPQPKPPPEAPPARTVPRATVPAVTAPKPTPRPRPQPEQAPPEATGRTPSTGAVPEPGTARVETNARGQGFGLSSAGGGGSGVQLDVGNFCCPGYLQEMVTLIQRNWNQRQGVAGSAIVRFTIQRNGTIADARVERSSGFYALDNAAERALLLTARLPPLPADFPNPTLVVHLRFDYQP